MNIKFFEEPQENISTNEDEKKRESFIREELFTLVEDKKIRASLGEELFEKYEEEIGEAKNINELSSIEKRLIEAVEYRNSPFKDFPTTDEDSELFNNNLKEDLKRETRKQLEKIIEKCQKGEFEMLGQGFTAMVSNSKRCSEYCYKVVYDVDEYKKGNNIFEETKIQDSLVDLNIEGVRVPVPYYCKMSLKKHVMIMETLDAVTIGDILDRKEQLPEKFDLETFFKALKSFVKEMHKRGVHHRDFHSGNVMIDRESGLPRIIDFGKSKVIQQKDLEYAERYEDEIYTTEKDLNGNAGNIKMITDLEHIDDHYFKLKNYLDN